MTGPLQFPAPGIYLHMPESIYHRIPALSKTLVHAFNVSPIDAWELHFGNREETRDLLYGNGLHVFLLEGQEELEKRYFAKFNPANYPDALKTVEDLKGWLKGKGLPVTGSKPKLIDAVQAEDPTVEIIDVLKVEHDSRSENKIEIPNDDMEEILSREWVRKVDFLAHENAFCEVSFFWYDEKLGCNCKARLDSISIEPEHGNLVIGDVKSFTNKNRKNIEECVKMETAYRQYHIDAYFYLRAFRNTPVEFHETATEPGNWPEPTNAEFRLLYVEKGKRLPNVLPREVEIHDASDSLTLLGQVASGHVHRAANLYNSLTEEFGDKPWNRAHRREVISGEEIPEHLL